MNTPLHATDEQIAELFEIMARMGDDTGAADAPSMPQESSNMEKGGQ